MDGEGSGVVTHHGLWADLIGIKVGNGVEEGKVGRHAVGGTTITYSSD